MSLKGQYARTERRNPYEDASIWSRVTFSWVLPLIMEGYRRPLEAEDIPWIPGEFSCAWTSALFQKYWDAEVALGVAKADAGRALRGCVWQFRLAAYTTFLPFIGIVLLQPYLVNDILKYISGSRKDYALGWDSGIGLALLLGVLSLINPVFSNMSFFSLNRAGFAMKSATIAAVFKKSLRLSGAARAKHTSGQIVTLISGDAERVWNSILYSNWIWAGPLMTIIAMILLIVEAGWGAVAAFASMLFFAAFQSWAGLKVGDARKFQVGYTDERTKLINEVLQGIRIIKFYGWEKATAKRIQEMRVKEVEAITLVQLLKMINTVMMFIGPLIVGFVLFIVYIRQGGTLTVSKVYTIFALLNVIRLPFSLTPVAWASWHEGGNAFKRLTEFLLLEEIDYGNLITNGEVLAGSNSLLRLVDACFAWDPTAETPTLQHITLDVKKDDFIAVVGSVGSGKSSLIAAILGQMVHVSGQAAGVGTIRAALVAQEHWIQNVNLRENVLFDSRFDEQAYGRALSGSQLVQDLLVLPNADTTSIGERGLNLSGGQKARVSVARALYAGNNFDMVSPATLVADDAEQRAVKDEKESTTVAAAAVATVGCGEVEVMAVEKPIAMYIFDDSLASVDVHVGRALFEDAMQSDVARRACRLVSLSSNYHVLPHFSKIVVMEKGQVAMVGSYAEVIQAFPSYRSLNDADGNLDEEISEVVEHQHEHEDNHEQNRQVAVELMNVSVNLPDIHSANEETIVPLVSGEASSLPQNSYEVHLEAIERKRHAADDIMTEEDREKGAVALKTYVSYFSFLNPKTATLALGNSNELKEGCSISSMYGWLMLITIVLLFSLGQLLRIFSDLWIGMWAADRQGTSHSKHQSDNFYRNWFIILVWATVALTVLRSVVFLLSCLGASRNLHQILLQAVLRAPINTYFDVTPVGRILNRFSKDLDSMDSLLPDFFLQTLQNGFAVLAIMLMCLVSSSYFVLLFLPIGVAFYVIQLVYRKSSREMKRLDSVSRSPMFSLFGETLQGLMTIRAFGREDIVTKKFFYLADKQCGTFFVSYTSGRWLALRLDIVANFLVLAVALFSVLLAKSGSFINPNLLGVALVYSLQLTALMQWTVRSSIDLETNMTSVERLLSFADIQPESQITLRELRNSSKEKENQTDYTTRSRTTSQQQELEFSNLRSNWPSVGCIELSNVVMRYRPELPLVLRGVSLKIPGGKKVGVCGRTGAGKSSLMLALFRIVECEAGSQILIDGDDIRSVPLTVLRNRLTIIPQDPFMFSGTLRENLDPFNVYSDMEIWEALARVHLKEDILEKFPEKLLHKVSERGENISVGQRQLVCIARALLRNSKVIVMDEVSRCMTYRVVLTEYGCR
jgi:ATP-binding cassette, subfamily C (CFTR/MRP), member 1